MDSSNYQTISTCGFCGTGSSAVSDYLKEFNENQVLDGMEFTFSYLPDGFEDLEYHLVKHICRDDASSLAIPRFRRFMHQFRKVYRQCYGISYKEYDSLIEKYISSLVQFSWKNVRRDDILLYPTSFYYYFASRFVVARVIPILNKIAGHHIHIWPHRNIEVSSNPENFVHETQDFFVELFRLMGADFGHNIVLDQAFLGEDPTRSFHFFKNPKAIVVDRDPRDLYLISKLFWKEYQYLPNNSVEEYCAYHRLLRDNKPYKKNDNRVLNIYFDELVYEYESTTKKIRDFCDLPENPNPRTLFRPERSITNTQLWYRYKGFEDDIKFIEDNLTDYLFDYSKYPAPDISGKMYRNG